MSFMEAGTAEKHAREDNHAIVGDAKRAKADKWQWHVLLTRSRMSVAAEDPANVIPVDEHAAEVSLGWNLTIVRLKEEKDEETAFAQQPCPWLAGASQDDEFPSMINMQALQEALEAPTTLQPLLAWPFGSNIYLLGKLRILLSWRESVYSKHQPPLNLVTRALELCAAGGAGVEHHLQEERLLEEVEMFGHSPEDLRAARNERPAAIHIHLSSEIQSVMRTSLPETCRKLFPNAQVMIQDSCKRTSSSLVERVLWMVDFFNHMDFRAAVMYNGGRSTNDRGRAIGIGTEDYWGCGMPLKNLPLEEQDAMESTYKAAIQLLATRPWKRFAGFEILKIVIANKDGGIRSTKWIMFSSDSCSEADSMTQSPFGFMQIFHSLAEKNLIFGASAVLFGMMGHDSDGGPPDRLFVSADRITGTDYDSILLLEELFGEPLASPELPPGVIPLLEADTGRIESHVGRGGPPTSARTFTKDEMDWVRLVAPCLAKFVVEERESCDPNGGEYIKSYNVDASTLVTVSYNMGEENGGQWDRDRKWRWFR